MLHSAITAFVQRDVDRARAVIDNDDEADVLYQEFQRELRAILQSEESGAPSVAPRTCSLSRTTWSGSAITASVSPNGSYFPKPERAFGKIAAVAS